MRYYYSDPLEAAYMAKNFGMRFIMDSAGDVMVGGNWLSPGDEIEKGPIQSKEDNILSFVKHSKAIIHPDSLKILEPQEGDLIWLDGPDAEYVYGRHQDGKLAVMNDNEEYLISNSQKILERNGKPFFWPLVEEADTNQTP